MSSSTAAPPRAGNWFKRIGLAVIAAVLAVNLYTGAPLLAIWAGSRVQNGTGLTMGTVGVVIGVLVVAVTILVILLQKTEAAYRRASGQEQERRREKWLRSLRDERAELAERKPMTGIEKSMVVAVVVCVVAFEAWFFFLSGSPIG